MFEVLAKAFTSRIDAPFLTDPNQSLTYGDIVDRSAQMATVLAAAGAAEGRRVMVQVEKTPEAVALYLASLRLGTVYVPLNPAYTDAEVAYFREDAKPAVFVGAPGRPATDLTLEIGGGSLATATDRATPSDAVVERSDDDLAALLYTSGTTGRPKGAMLTHGLLAANARALHKAWAISEDDTLVHALPIFHVHGLFVALHCAMLSGCPVIFLPRFEVDVTIDALGQATVFMGVPTLYTRLLADERFDADACSRMRLFTSGSAPMSTATHDKFTARTGRRIVERYGLSEVGILTSNRLDGVPGHVGYPLDGVQLRIVDDQGESCAAGTTGNVEAKPQWGFGGYWNNPSASAAAMRPDGWFVTGDVGSLDDKGRLTLEGRSSDMIISGGYNIYPKEIELALDACDTVAESAVVGVPHPDLGETVLAVIVADGPFAEPDLNTRLARFKHPRGYEIVDQLPRNAMGKVVKADLRTRFANRFMSDRK